MPRVSSTTSPGYKYLLPSKPLPRISYGELLRIGYTILIFVFSLLLIGLGLRLIFALLIIDNVFARGLTIFTEPFVSPFTHKFPDSHEMLQASTASAFTIYFVLHSIASFIAKIVSRDQRLSNQHPSQDS